MIFKNSMLKFSDSDLDRGIIIPEFPNIELAEEMGWHAGDGSMNFYSGKGLYQLRGHLIDNKEHYVNYISYIYKKIYNLNLNVREMPSTGVAGFQVWSDVLVDFKSGVLGFPLGKKYDLKIPGFILEKEEFIISFVRGLFDTDGCFYLENKNRRLYPRIEIKTTLKTMSFQLHKCLNGLGFRFTLYEHPRKEKNWANIFALILRGNAQCKKWIERVGTNNPKYIKKYNAWWQPSGN